MWGCVVAIGILFSAISNDCVVGIGMVFAAISVTVAGVLEIFRLENVEETGGFVQVISGTPYNASYFSIFLQVPQFVWIGAGEVFTSITSRWRLSHYIPVVSL